MRRYVAIALILAFSGCPMGEPSPYAKELAALMPDDLLEVLEEPDTVQVWRVRRGSTPEDGEQPALEAK